MEEKQFDIIQASVMRTISFLSYPSTKIVSGWSINHIYIDPLSHYLHCYAKINKAYIQYPRQSIRFHVANVYVFSIKFCFLFLMLYRQCQYHLFVQYAFCMKMLQLFVAYLLPISNFLVHRGTLHLQLM